MAASSFVIDVSYCQIAVFWSSLPQPFNDWTQKHVDQGFAWRPGSVSFRTLVESGVHSVQIEVVDYARPIGADVLRAIEVPFEVPSDGDLEVASISDSVPLSLSPGNYSLRCELLEAEEEEAGRVRLVFARADVARFAVLRADDDLTIGEELLTTAEAAVT